MSTERTDLNRARDALNDSNAFGAQAWALIALAAAAEALVAQVEHLAGRVACVEEILDNRLTKGGGS